MNNKKQSPSPKGNHQKQVNNIKIHLSPTESRIVKLLLKQPYISYDLEYLAFCRYAADNIQHIRQKGISIITTMVDYIRKVDNKNVKVGQYSIDPDSLEKARLAVASD